MAFDPRTDFKPGDRVAVADPPRVPFDAVYAGLRGAFIEYRLSGLAAVILEGDSVTTYLHPESLEPG